MDGLPFAFCWENEEDSPAIPIPQLEPSTGLGPQRLGDSLGSWPQIKGDVMMSQNTKNWPPRNEPRDQPATKESR